MKVRYKTLGEFFNSTDAGPVYFVNMMMLEMKTSKDMDTYLIRITRDENGTYITTPEGKVVAIPFATIKSDEYSNYYVYQNIEDAKKMVLSSFDTCMDELTRQIEVLRETKNGIKL